MPLTKEQTRLKSLARSFLFVRSSPATVCVQPQGDGVTLALVFEACGHTFLARGRLEPFASTSSIYDECTRLVYAFKRLWAHTTGQVDPHDPDDRCAGRWSPTVYG